MNWLAHVFLSEDDINFQIGNYLTDHLRARAWEGAHSKINQGMQTHKLIDSFTDSHEIFKQSKNRLKEQGLLRSIVIDITYDYLLVRNWNKFSTIDFDEFTENFYKNTYEILDSFPLNVQDILSNLIRNQLINRCKTLNDLQQVFERTDYRLSQKLLKRDNVSSYFNLVKDNIENLNNDFLVFFPQLCKEIEKSCNSKKLKHIKSLY